MLTFMTFSALLLNTIVPIQASYSGTTKYNPFSTSTLREHGDHELCSDPLDSVNYLHRLEKRSYLPPVTCTKNHEMSVVRSKVHCQPRPRLVRLPWPNDTSVHKMTPSHIEVNRCDGGCFHRQQSCLPVRIKKTKIPILLARCTIHSEKCDKICAEVEVDEHTECGCECKVKRHHCNEKQIYREELCSCHCRDLSEVQACHDSGRVWDPGMCMCRCPLASLQQCSTNFVFDFTNSCKCIPEESNELPGKRSERSHTTPHPNWQIMTICGLTLLVLILLITLFSLAKHVKRLRLRLRHSAEVLVPSNTAPIIIASQRRTWIHNLVQNQWWLWSLLIFKNNMCTRSKTTFFLKKKTMFQFAVLIVRRKKNHYLQCISKGSTNWNGLEWRYKKYQFLKPPT